MVADTHTAPETRWLYAAKEHSRACTSHFPRFSVCRRVSITGVTSRRGSREEFQGGSIAGWDSPTSPIFSLHPNFSYPSVSFERAYSPSFLGVCTPPSYSSARAPNRLASRVLGSWDLLTGLAGLLARIDFMNPLLFFPIFIIGHT